MTSSSGQLAAEQRAEVPATPPRVNSERAQRLLPLVLLVTALLYLPAVFADFVNMDDGSYVTLNPDVREPHLSTIFDPRHYTVFDWTPVVTLSHAVEYRLFGLDPMPYHATNVLLHLMCAALVYLLLRDLGVTPAEGVAAALVFAVHPLQVESVAWISVRKNLLAALFGLLFVRSFLAGRAAIATAWLALALGSKGTAVVFPLWAVAALYFGFGSLRGRRALPWLALYGVMALGRGILSTVAQAHVVGLRDVAQMSLSQRMTIMGPVLATQIRQFFAPYDLSLRYAWWPRAWSDPQVLASWGLLLLLAASVAWWGRRDQRIAVAGCFALIALLPTANIVAAPDFQADRYAHLALVGGALLAVVLLRPLARVHRLLPAGMLALWCLLVLAPITWARIGVWHDSERLWQDTLRRYPGWVFGWDLLAKHYLDHHQLEKAEPVLQRMLELERDNADARYNLALLSYNTERSGEAAAQLHTLLEQHPDHADGHCLLGRILIAEGRSDEGLAQLDAALRLEPRHVIARYLRARVCRQQGRLDAASADLETLVGSGQAPSAVWIELAQLRLQQNRVDDALAAAHRSVDQDARFAEGWDILGQALLAAGDIASAEAAVRQGLRGNPDDADLRYHLAEVLQRRGDPEAARTAATEALRLLGTAQRDWTERARSLADGVR